MIHITSDQIENVVTRLASEIKRDYPDQKFVLLGVLNGAYQFTSDLSKHFSENVILDFTQLKSYDGTKTTKEVKMILPPRAPIAGNTIIVIEDIVDSGFSMKWLKGELTNMGAKEVKICTLLNKQARRQVDITADYIGTEIDDEFVVGYGMDYNGYYRTLPNIRSLTEKEIENGKPM